MGVSDSDKQSFDEAWAALNAQLCDVEAQHGFGEALQRLYEQQRTAGFDLEHHPLRLPTGHRPALL